MKILVGASTAHEMSTDLTIVFDRGNHENKVYTDTDGSVGGDVLVIAGVSKLKSSDKNGKHDVMIVLNANHMAKANLNVDMSNKGNNSISIDITG